MPVPSPPGSWRLICAHPGRVFHHLGVLTWDTENDFSYKP
jgi:hypothetical protein